MSASDASADAAQNPIYLWCCTIALLTYGQLVISIGFRSSSSGLLPATRILAYSELHGGPHVWAWGTPLVTDCQPILFNSLVEKLQIIKFYFSYLKDYRHMTAMFPNLQFASSVFLWEYFVCGLNTAALFTSAISSWSSSFADKVCPDCFLNCHDKFFSNQKDFISFFLT